jgi:hypothetical protein
MSNPILELQGAVSSATKTRRTPTFRRFTHCFLQACTTVTWSSRVDRSTQSSLIQALGCSFRRISRLM